MPDEQEPYDPRNIYAHEASGRDALGGKFGGWDDVTVDAEELDITPELRRHATYLSPYRMDHITELHSDRASSRKTGKSLFPADWSDDKIFQAAQAVASDLSSKWTRGDDDFSGEPDTLFNPWHKLDVELAIPARFRVDGVFDDVKMRVIVEPYGEGIISAYTLLY